MREFKYPGAFLKLTENNEAIALVNVKIGSSFICMINE